MRNVHQNVFEKMNKELQEYTQNALFISSLTNPSTRAVNNVIYAIVAVLGPTVL